MDERQVRMKLIMRLLLGPHNDYKEMLAHDAKKHWEEIETLKANEMKELMGAGTLEV
ncbi:hypothetical protein MtrunA17_Chr8g0348401 [Medicago truncatula]|nr:hypothetical protein MtrunA17_Chr8g0348401 [Medicago truncatula]